MDKLKDCKMTQDACIDFSALLTVAQQYINDRNIKISEIEKLPNLKSKDVFISELRNDIKKDEKVMLNAVNSGKKCGCLDIGIGILFA